MMMLSPKKVKALTIEFLILFDVCFGNIVLTDSFF